MVPLQFVDNFLLSYHVGYAILLAFGLAMVGALVLRSWRLGAVNLLLFGFLFLTTPAGVYGEGPQVGPLLLTPLAYKMIGVLLLVVGPMVYAVMVR